MGDWDTDCEHLTDVNSCRSAFGYNQTNFRPLTMDPTSRSLAQTGLFASKIRDGDAYYLNNQIDVSTATRNLLITTPDTAKWAHMHLFFATEAEAYAVMYRDVTTSNDGAAWSFIQNYNDNSANTSGLVFTSEPTLNSGSLGDKSDGGTALWGIRTGTGSTATAPRELYKEFILKQNTKYWFQITKVAAGTIWVDWEFSWYEHTDLAT